MTLPIERHLEESLDIRETVLKVAVYPDGRVSLQSCVTTADGDTDYAWVADILRQIADAQDLRAAALQS
jgi:hypothetical protein